MVEKLGEVLVISLGRNKESKVIHEEEFNLEIVHFIAWYTADLCVIGVVEVLIIEELCGQHHARDKETVDVERVDNERRVSLNDPVNVDEC